MTALRFEIDGEYVHPDDAAWFMTAPCGCICGVTVSVRSGTVLADEETAWRAFEPDLYMRRQDVADGMRLALGLRADMKRKVTVDCPHDPPLGVAATPVPEGHVWVVERWDGRVKHLVLAPTNGCELSALCRRAASRHWTADDSEVRGKAECSPCRKAAWAAAGGAR